MSSQQIQFQYGMSILEFLTHFGTEAQCAEAIRRTRWPGGFLCPRCTSQVGSASRAASASAVLPAYPVDTM
jgi:hypothetical protein